MIIVTDERVAAFVGERVGAPIIPPFTAAGIEREGAIIAGVVFNGWTGPDVDVTVAGRGFTKGFLAEVGKYVFGQLGCLRMTIITEQPKIVRIAERLGGQVEGLLRSHFGAGRDGFIVGILRDDYRF